MILVQIVIFLLGWPLEWTEITIIFLPLFLPLLQANGVDLVWFGVLASLNMQTAFLSPPVAMSAYYLMNVAPKGILPQSDLQGHVPVHRLTDRGHGAALCVPRARDLAAESRLRRAVIAPRVRGAGVP